MQRRDREAMGKESLVEEERDRKLKDVNKEGGEALGVVFLSTFRYFRTFRASALEKHTITYTTINSSSVHIIPAQKGYISFKSWKHFT